MSQLPFDDDPPESPPVTPVQARDEPRAASSGPTGLDGRVGGLLASQGSSSSPVTYGAARVGMRLALVVAMVALLTVWLVPSARRVAYSFAYEVKDRLGLRLVEGHAELIRAAAVESQVDALLLAAIMFCESRGRVDAVSSANALGLMQLSLAAASDAAKRLELPEVPTAEQLTSDAELNVRLGAAHLRWLLKHRGDWSIEAVLVSYNAGRARLFGWLEKAGGWDAWVADQEDLIARGEPTSGALTYAREVLVVREELRERGKIVPIVPVTPPE